MYLASFSTDKRQGEDMRGRNGEFCSISLSLDMSKIREDCEGWDVPDLKGNRYCQHL